MKATELRIGNIIDINNKIISVTIEDINRINYNTIPGYSPIPLTEEILLKVGFEKVREFYTIDFNEFVIFKDNKGFYTHINSGNIYLTSLHQLQNLYYFTMDSQELNTSGLI